MAFAEFQILNVQEQNLNVQAQDFIFKDPEYRHLEWNKLDWPKVSMLLIVVHYALHLYSESAPLFFSQLAGSAKAEQTTRDIVDGQFKAPAPHA